MRGMRENLRRWLPWIKIVLFLLVVGAVGYHFWNELQKPELRSKYLTFHRDQILPMILSGVLYLAGLGFFAWFWLWVLRCVGQPLNWLVGIRGYYISHLGKYTPGKGLALILRTAFAVQGGVTPGTAVLTATYETLTTMAAGALVAAVLMLLQSTQDPSMLWKALGLLALAGIPIIPAVFNFAVKLLSKRFKAEGELLLPKLKFTTLIVGILVTACGWLLFGVSLMVVLRALSPETMTLSWKSWLSCTSGLALAYVAGFLALFTPGGLGVRELFLQQFLTRQLQMNPALAVVAVVVLRVLWTVAELVMALITYFLPKQVEEVSDVSGTATS